MQTAVGVPCVVLGCLHFLDRSRAPEQIRSFYLGALIPRTSTALGPVGVIEVIVGFALIFSASFV